MNNNLPLPPDKKLTVVFRVEPGCLGPDGENHIEAFCSFAQKEFIQIESDYVCWEIIPRHDKLLPEMQYLINNKKLTQDKAAKYLELFNKDIDELEENLHETLVRLIEQYFEQ